jgi:peptide-methionine (R)-S-oxide reductase
MNTKNKPRKVMLLFAVIFMLTQACTVANQEDKRKPNMNNTANTNTPKVEKTDEEWRAELTPMQYYVLRQKGTERPYTGAYWDNKDVGTYLCAGCSTLLFTFKTKYDSGCGWPSFYEAHNNDQILMRADNSHGMQRVEILCATCEGHLGHVFNDGPEPTGLRYCVNSESMIFIPAENED